MTRNDHRSPRGDLVLLDRRDPERLQPEHASDVIRVVLAHDGGLLRAGLRALFDGARDITAVGEAANAQQAIALALERRPDVLLLDVLLPDLDAIEVIRRIRRDPRGAEVKVLVLTSRDEDERLLAALSAGATGVLQADSEPPDLLHAIRIVARGGAALSAGATRCVIEQLASVPQARAHCPEQLSVLTPREREVVALAALGLNNDQIAERLVVTRATAKTHVNRAMGKLNARDRAQLVALAYQSGLVQPRRRWDGESSAHPPAPARRPARISGPPSGPADLRMGPVGAETPAERARHYFS